MAAVLPNHLACNGTGMQWYIDMVGETPCQTYQSLRGICNSQYTVGVQNVNTPPDTCSDQLSTCCCNTIAFALSMLCLNCQQPIGSGTGIDAGATAYQGYVSTCSGPVSNALPKDIQTAVCNKQLKINDDLYSNGWSDGSWFYIYTRDTIVKDNIVAGNNSFTHCASTTLHTSSSSSIGSSSSSSSTRSNPTSSPSASVTPSPSTGLGSGAIAGIAVAALAAVALALLGFLCWRRRRVRYDDGRRAGVLEAPLDNDGDRDAMQERPGSGRFVVDSYPYSDTAPTSNEHITHGAPHSAVEGSLYNPYSDSGSSGYGAAAVAGAASAGAGASQRRGFHTQQLSGDNSTSALSGSGSGAGSSGRQAGPLPRKNRVPVPAIPRADSAEPFLEAEEAEATSLGGAPVLSASTSERHVDAGPVDHVSLGRSASGRLPPAYGEQV